MAKSESASGMFGSGISFLSLLTIVFVTLKLTGHIDWSWWWILSPMWAPWAVLFGIGGTILMVACIVKALEKK